MGLVEVQRKMVMGLVEVQRLNGQNHGLTI